MGGLGYVCGGGVRGGAGACVKAECLVCVCACVCVRVCWGGWAGMSHTLSHMLLRLIIRGPPCRLYESVCRGVMGGHCNLCNILYKLFIVLLLPVL